jgi:hypothetical protein
MAVDLPDMDEARRTLARLDVPAEAVDDILAGRPTPGSAEWDQLEDYHRQLTTTDRPTFWPTPPDDAPPPQRWVQLWAFLAALPHAFELNASRGIPDDVSWDTLLEIGVNVERYMFAHGQPGFDGAWWLSQHIRGQIYRLGRLVFNTWAVAFDPGPDVGFVKGDPALGVHIPAAGPFTPEACDDAFARAREFFPRHLPDQPFAVATCESWLLDEQLDEVLPPDSNILRFRRRFTIAEGWELPGDDDIRRFVFGNPDADIETVTPTTRLGRFVVERLRSGGHFKVRGGWIRV